MKRLITIILNLMILMNISAQSFSKSNSEPKQSSKTDASVTADIEGNYLVLRSYGDLIGLNVDLNDNFGALGYPQDIGLGWIIATNINSTTYRIGVMILNPPSEGSVILKMPILIAVKDLSLYLNVNGVDQVIKIDLSGVIISDLTNTKENKIKFYPNPVKNILAVSIEDIETERYSVEIVNVLGQSIFSAIEITNHTSINLSSICKNGYYTLIVRDNVNQIVLSEKIIKE